MPLAWVESLVNAFTVISSTSVGAALGFLWAMEAALVGSGIITVAFQQSFRVIVDNERDEIAGARALTAIREAFDRLRNLGGLRGIILSSTLFICGLYDDPAIERLAAEANAGRAGDKARPRAFSELLGLAVESTLSARFFDLKVLLVGLAALLVGSVDGAVYLLAGLGR